MERLECVRGEEASMETTRPNFLQIMLQCMIQALQHKSLQRLLVLQFSLKNSNLHTVSVKDPFKDFLSVGDREAIPNR